VEERSVRVTAETAEHGKQAVSVCHKLILFDKPASFVGESFFILESECTSYQVNQLLPRVSIEVLTEPAHMNQS
jgi:hypothetical protein